MAVESSLPNEAVLGVRLEISEDEVRLAKLGYKQEYHRIFTLWTNFGLSSSMVSVLLGVIPLYTYSLAVGGSAVLVWSWVIVGFMSLFVVSSMAEICAAFPTMGALYYWSYRLGGPKWGPFASWTAGWCNLLGQIGGVASGGYSGALVIADIVQITTDHNMNQFQVLGLYAGTLVLAGIVNSFPELLTSLCWISVTWHIIGVLVIVVLMNCFAPTHQTVGWVLTDFNNATNFTSNFYAGLIGLLAAASTYTGYDTAAHVAEETQQSHNSSPWAMVGAVINCLVLGLVLIIGMNFAIQNIDDLTNANNPNGAATTLWLQLLGVPLTVLLNIILFVAIECSNCANLTSCARMIYSFSRDGALPFSAYWHNVDPRTYSPVRAIALSVVVSFLVALPGFANDAILGALFSLTATGLLASYIIPIFLRITVSRHTFKAAEFNLGRWALPCGTIAVAWSFLMLVLVCLPQETPITMSTLNYSPVMLGVMLVGAWAAWILSARKWFKGIPSGDTSVTSDPQYNGSPEPPEDPEAPEDPEDQDVAPLCDPDVDEDEPS
jgi:amino acid transporter